MKDVMSPLTHPPSTPIPDRNPQAKTLRGYDDRPALKSKSMSYSGEQIIGISVVHKSGLKPVFSKQEAEELAKMRR